MPMKTQMFGAVAGLMLAAMLSGCASTSIISEWRDPEVKEAGPYKKFFVTAITKQETVRRQLEDAFKDNLAALGAAGIASYGPLTATAEANKEQLVKAVKETDADAVLVVRMVKRETETSISPAYYGPTGYYNGYHSSWDGFYEPMSVYQYDVITLEVKLYEVKTGQLVWAASTETVDPGKLQKEISAYAKLICERMGTLKLIASPVM